MCEIFADDKIGRVDTVGINRDIVRVGLDSVRCRTTLDATEVKVGLVINTSHLIRYQRAVVV